MCWSTICAALTGMATRFRYVTATDEVVSLKSDAETATVGSAADLDAAEDFLRAYHGAHPEAGSLRSRLTQVRAEISGAGTYLHTAGELNYGARIALRDSGWCTSGVPWRQLKVRDLRGVRTPSRIAQECFEHLRLATNAGTIQPLISVFAPDSPRLAGPRIWNEQVVRYAGYASDTDVLGDARYCGFTETVRQLGWKPPAQRSRFDHLPLVVETDTEGPQIFDVPRDVVQEVPLEHPDLPWFVHLGLRWHSVPLISNMSLHIGGITYPAAPFNTWFVGTEIGTRALAAENSYDLLHDVARHLKLDTSTERTLWRDRAIIEINRAVLFSFDSANTTISDHHSETLHRLSWLRSRPQSETQRPAFSVTQQATERARNGGPACFAHEQPTDTRNLRRLDRRRLLAWRTTS